MIRADDVPLLHFEAQVIFPSLIHLSVGFYGLALWLFLLSQLYWNCFL